MLEAAAAAVPSGPGGLLCLPYWTGAMTPYWDGHARGAFVGLSGLHGKPHIYRAILEGIALEQRLLTSGVEAATGTAIDEILMLGGGSRSPLWCQIIADVIGRPSSWCANRRARRSAPASTRPRRWADADIAAAAEAMTGIDTRIQPDAAAHDRYTEIFAAYRSIYPGLKHVPTAGGDGSMKRSPPSPAARRYSPADIEQLRQMTRAARLHHVQGARQTEIAEKMGMSQAGVSRLLRMAEEQGIIRSIVVPPEGLYPDLEDGLVEAFGLDAASVVDIGPTEETSPTSSARRRRAASAMPSTAARCSASPRGARRCANWRGDRAAAGQPGPSRRRDPG